MTAFLQYKALLKAEMANTFGNKNLRTATAYATKKDSPAKKLAFFILMGVAAVVLILFYLVTMAISLTVVSVKSGAQKEELYFLFAIVQLITLFFGIVGGVSMLYFSKDNALLSALPVLPSVRFAVKFTMLYLGEFAFSAVLSLPLLLTYGIVCNVMNAGLPWHFFLYVIINTFLLPAFPLLLIAIVSLPIMYLMKFLRRLPYGKHIGQILMTVIGFGIYFAIVIGANVLMPEGEEGEMSTALLAAFGGIRNATIFNYPMIEAMWGNHTAGYFFAYIAESIGLIVLGLGLSSLFYTRALQAVLESDGGTVSKRKKGKTELNYQKSSFMKSFLLKEWKTIAASPALLLSVFSSSILIPVMAVVFGVVFSTADDPEVGNVMQTMLVPIMTMMGLIGSGMNMVSMIGISREGKTFLYMKSMPVPVEVMLQAKLTLSMIISFICIILLEIALPIAIRRFSPSVFIGNFVVLTVYSWGMNCIGLRSDLKNPNLNWNNVNELTNNNKRTLKPALFGMGISFVIMIVGIVLSVIDSLSQELTFLIFYVVALIPAVIVAFVGDRLLRRDAMKFFEAIGE